MSAPESPLLVVQGLKVHFPVVRGIVFRREGGLVKAVDGVSFTVTRGETLGLVGESGCGKSTTALAVLRMLEPTSGRIVFDGEDITRYGEAAMRPIRRRVQMVYQDPFGSLDRRMSVADIIAEPLLVHGLPRFGPNASAVCTNCSSWSASGLTWRGSIRMSFPAVSASASQSRALAMQPDLLICDEPVSALDVSIQAQIVDVLQEIQQRFGLAYIFVAHDLAVVRHISDRIAVMYLGKIVEIAPRKALYERPRHPYTQALLAAVPIPDPEAEARRPQVAVIGEVPSALSPPTGCRFHTRCPQATEICRKTEPALCEIGSDALVACHLYDTYQTQSGPKKLPQHS